MHSTENYQHNDVNDTSTNTNNYNAEFKWLSNRKVRRYANKHRISVSDAFKKLYK